MIHLAACALALVGFVGVALVHRTVHAATGWVHRDAARDAAHAELTRRRAAEAAANAWWLSLRSGGEA